MVNVEENLKRVREKIDDAAAKSGRRGGDITLVAVTKTVDIELMKRAFAAGEADFGENRVQEFIRKRGLVDEKINWHLIGQIQTNKVKYITRGLKLIHSLDRLPLALEMEKRGQAQCMSFETLLEVNLSLEDSKSGVRKEDLGELVSALCGLKHVKINGFMTMAPYGTDDESARPYFGALSELFAKYKNVKADNFDMKYLSMGMSHDYYGAILEGANIVRIGSAIFGSRL